ncbi:hypothetical protein F2Q69_00054498 [Brassica cretica]|uniref:Uncharacterized protein n=1 Tax=Brassica cretica TaxID=69181 RepID=A0A8S9N769_BRACR|nr:hypothetical protein F2Q69_00054498 [Brassica cretica]
MHGLMSYQHFGRARSLRSDRTACMCCNCVMTELGSIRTKLYLGNTRCDVFLTEHDLLRKDILVFCGDLDVNFVVTVFDPNNFNLRFFERILMTYSFLERIGQPEVDLANDREESVPFNVLDATFILEFSSSQIFSMLFHDLLGSTETERNAFMLEDFS